MLFEIKPCAGLLQPHSSCPTGCCRVVVVDDVGGRPQWGTQPFVREREGGDKKGWEGGKRVWGQEGQQAQNCIMGLAGYCLLALLWCCLVYAIWLVP